MWVPSTSVGLAIDIRKVLIVASLGLLLVVWLVAHPPFGVMLLLACVLPAFLFVEWLIVRKARPAFEKEFSRYLQRGEVERLRELVKGAHALRWFGPPGYIDEKQGLIASLNAEWLAANDHLERAYLLQSTATRRALLPAILRAKYENGLWDEAEEIARELLGKTRYPGTPELFLGLILARHKRRHTEAKKLLQRAVEALGGPDRERAEKALRELGAGR